MFPLLYVVMINGLSSVPGEPLAEEPGVYTVVRWIPPQVQNLLHIPLFGLLAMLWHWSLRAWVSRGWVLSAMALLLTGSYGILDELHQATVPGRYGSLTDMGLNFLGALLGVWLCRRRSRSRR